MLMFLATPTAVALMAIPAVVVDYSKCEAAAVPFRLKRCAHPFLEGPVHGRWGQDRLHLARSYRCCRLVPQPPLRRWGRRHRFAAQVGRCPHPRCGQC